MWECAHTGRDGTSGCSEGKYLPGTPWADVKGDFGLRFGAVGAAPLAELTARRNQANDPLHPQVIQVLWRETQRNRVRQRHRQSDGFSLAKIQRSPKETETERKIRGQSPHLRREDTSDVSISECGQMCGKCRTCANFCINWYVFHTDIALLAGMPQGSSCYKFRKIINICDWLISDGRVQ